jgi:hypothetical protein
MMEHLTESVRAVVSLSKKARKEYVNGYKWVGYSRAQEVLQRFNDLLEQPPIPRMPHALLIGEGNNGKTNLVDRFQKQHQAYVDEEQSKVITRVLVIEAPPEADEKRFYERVLQKLFVPYRTNHKPEVLYQQVLHVLRSINLRVLVIDEIHNILAGKIGNRQIFLNMLKSLSNELRISIVAVGTKDAFHVFQSDPQMASRFEPLPLPRWQLDKEYLRLLVTYEKLLPLPEKSNLGERQLASRILSLTDGTIGGITSVIKKATIKAIDTDSTVITLEIVNSLNMVLPSERNRMPTF